MICIAENNGQGGVAGGAGSSGQPSQTASGSAASSYGWPVLECVTGTPCDLVVQLTKDYDGSKPADLSDIEKVVFCFQPDAGRPYGRREKECIFTNDGVVTVSLDEKDLHQQGVFYAEFRCSDKDGHDRQNYRSWLCIRKGTKGSNEHGPRTVTCMDVRLAIMDMSASANELLGDLEFSDAQILHAVQRCIDQWEEMPPDLTVHYNATNFPWPESLVTGVVGVLLMEKAYQFMRNKMNYSAGGFTLDQNDKGGTYIQLAQAATMEWKNFINTRKGSLNAEEAFGFINIPEFD